MHFSLIVLQLNGQVSDRAQRTDAEFQPASAMGQVTESFRRMLQEKLPVVFENVARFTLPMDDAGRFVLEWTQLEPFSAVGTFVVESRLAFSCLFLSGFWPPYDAAVVLGTRELLANWLGLLPCGHGLDPDVLVARFTSLTERPLLVCIPWPAPVTSRDQKLVAIWSSCLARAFFDRAAGLVRQPSPGDGWGLTIHLAIEPGLKRHDHDANAFA